MCLNEEKAEEENSARDLPRPETVLDDTDAVLAHTKTLASDEFEGRGPGTKGENLTVNFIVDQFKQIGLKPGPLLLSAFTLGALPQ